MSQDKRRIRIVVLDDYQQAAEPYFRTQDFDDLCDPEITIHSDRAPTSDELVARIAEAEVVVVMRERSPMPAEILAQLHNTELLVTTGTRNRSIDLVAAREHGITVCSTRGRGTGPSELTWAILMALVRRIPAEDRGVRTGQWGVSVGDTLSGKVLGILGFGRIGRNIARYGRAFGMDVIANSRSLTRSEAELQEVEAVSREALFRESDVLSVHLKLNDETRHTIGWPEFGLMKPSAYFVNTARGALVREADLVKALETGKLRGAALDVFETEPLPSDSPFLGLDNVVLTPHIGYVSTDRYEAYYGQTREIIRYHLAGEPIRVIN